MRCHPLVYRPQKLICRELFLQNSICIHGCQGDLAASPLPCSSTSIIYPECTSGPALTSVSSKPTLIACQPISNQKHNYLRRSSMKVSSDSIMNSHLLRHQRSSIKHAQLGKLISRSEGSTTRVVDTVPFPLNESRFLFQKIALHKLLTAGPFPVRVQPVGTSQVCLPAQVNPCRLSNTTGQPQHDVPAQLPKDFPRADCADAQVIPAPKVDFQSQASSVLYQSSLKRRANENSLSAPSSQRRRMMIPPPPRHPSVPHQQHYIPAPVPASPLHIKWRGFDGLPKPIGQKCFLCKRDLSFTAGGHVYQPAVPPAVAILPCGHTFHDHCMQTITPQDQSKNPPCIPCAIDET
ncbi:Uncharacterized protein Adt_29378 [Abeliophyllum distichum]|uniref:RING-type domain-containing protein n=1 Tax=Abeliophyllum distichum TaxID=126358 RepID=A0ABD1R867_9LAMI